jgi:hypothetical protein
MTVKWCVRRWAAIATTALGVASTGCATSTRVYVKSTAATNDGNTFYMMVRSVDGKTTTVNEQYQDVAAKLFADPPDPTVVVGQPIFPGNPVNLTLNESDAKQVIVYFFYTKPLTNWRVPLPRPLPAEVYVELGPNQIEHVQIRKH